MGLPEARRWRLRPRWPFRTGLCGVGLACAEIKNFEVNESLNYILISMSYKVAKYPCVMSCGFAATTRAALKGSSRPLAAVRFHR